MKLTANDINTVKDACSIALDALMARIAECPDLLKHDAEIAKIEKEMVTINDLYSKMKAHA